MQRELTQGFVVSVISQSKLRGSVGLHMDLTLSHSCKIVSLVTELSCALARSSNAFALAQGASQNRVPFGTPSLPLSLSSLPLRFRSVGWLLEPTSHVNVPWICSAAWSLALQRCSCKITKESKPGS